LLSPSAPSCYLVFVQPLRERFLRQSSSQAQLSPFLWERDGKVWPESRLSRCFEAACVRAQIPRLHIANWRQITVAIVKTKFAGDIGCFEMDDADEDGEEIAPDVRTMTEQRNHRTRTVNRAYANQAPSSSTFANLYDGLIRRGLRASQLWQAWLGVDILFADRKRKDGTLPAASMAKRIAGGIYKPRKPWSPDDLLVAMRRLYDLPEMQWKSLDQKRALATIMMWREQVVVVLPTGGGKSLLFMLPCTLPDAGVTILVVPLLALRGDLLRRVRELGIDHLEWTPGDQRDASLVFVSVEAAGHDSFMEYARGLVHAQRLDRIVVDECHLTITAADYRQSLVGLSQIRSLRTQFVYLTATLPPSMQAEFEERNHLYRPAVVRASVDRPNIHYGVERIAPGHGSLLEQVARDLRQGWVTCSGYDQSDGENALSKTHKQVNHRQVSPGCEGRIDEEVAERQMEELDRIKGVWGAVGPFRDIQD